MANVVSSLVLEGNTLPMLWLRYNPHSYKVEGRLARTTRTARHLRLTETLKNVSFEGQPSLRVAYMYYNTTEGLPACLSDPEYNATVREWHQIL